MSRRITITSTEQILELDLAEEVVKEMRQQGAHHLMLDVQKQVFSNQQYDDVAEQTLSQAVRLYGMKVQQRRTEQIEEKLKNSRYTTKIIKEGSKIKIVATQRVYV